MCGVAVRAPSSASCASSQCRLLGLSPRTRMDIGLREYLILTDASAPETGASFRRENR